MANQLFDQPLKQSRRDRAFRRGGDAFLLQRAFADCIERLSGIRRRFRSTLLLGCPDPRWREVLESMGHEVTVIEPGPRFAAAAKGICAIEDQIELGVGQYDLCISVGLVDTINDLPRCLGRLRMALGDAALLMAAFAGNDSLPALREAMRAFDSASGVAASPHVHPRIAAAAVAPLFQAAGFVMPVIDIDRVELRYRDLAGLIDDLRDMAATNLLSDRSRRPGGRAALKAAERKFADRRIDGKTSEIVEIIHATAWTPDDMGSDA